MLVASLSLASVPLAAHGLIIWSAVTFTFGGAAALAWARLNSYSGAHSALGSPPGPERGPEVKEHVVFTGDAEQEHLRTSVAGLYGISGQLHSAALVAGPILLLGALGLLVTEGLYVSAAWAAVIGTLLTWAGFIAGLKFEPAAPDVPNLRMVEVGRPWVTLVALVLGVGLLAWLLWLAHSADKQTDSVVIGATLVVGATLAIAYLRRVLLERSLPRPSSVRGTGGPVDEGAGR